jgi:hypothetical protein
LTRLSSSKERPLGPGAVDVAAIAGAPSIVIAAQSSGTARTVRIFCDFRI